MYYYTTGRSHFAVAFTCETPRPVSVAPLEVVMQCLGASYMDHILSQHKTERPTESERLGYFYTCMHEAETSHSLHQAKEVTVVVTKAFLRVRAGPLKMIEYWFHKYTRSQRFKCSNDNH